MVGYVPQHLRFDMTLPLTGAEMLRLAQRFHPRASKMLPWAIETFELAPFLRQPLGTLSGGQLKRLFLARALLHKPRLLLMDEPEAGVDTSGTQRLYQLLETLVAEQQLTALVISHELGIVLRVATQVICLNRRVHCVGVPGDLLTPQTMFELYGPSVTLISHDHDP